MNQWLKFRKSGAGSNLVDMGRWAVRDHRGNNAVINSEAGLTFRWGGRAEGLRRRRGDAVAVELGTSLTDRVRSERGNHPRSPSALPAGQPARRQAGPLPTEGRVVGRRPRSSPSAGEPRAWRRGPASWWQGHWNAWRLSPVNTDGLTSALSGAERRVRGIQSKLHRWARDDPHRRFDDLFNLVADPAFLLVAWDRGRPDDVRAWLFGIARNCLLNARRSQRRGNALAVRVAQTTTASEAAAGLDADFIEQRFDLAAAWRRLSETDQEALSSPPRCTTADTPPGGQEPVPQRAYSAQRAGRT